MVSAGRTTVGMVSAGVLFLMQACSYSFSGGSVAPDIKTISISPFENQAQTVQPLLAQNLTEALRDRFIQQSKLRLARAEGDLLLQGIITEYSVAPAAIVAQGNITDPQTGQARQEVAALNRLTIRVKVKFENTKRAAENWEQEFMQFADFQASQSLASIENTLIAEINEKMTQDIFNKALSNW